MRVYVSTRALVCALNRPKIRKSFETCNFFARYQKPFSLSRCLFWTMGLWDSGTMGRRDRREEKLFSLSHRLIFSLSFFWTMGLWDSGTMRRCGHQLKSRAKRTLPFTFHLSLFTFQFVVVPERTVRQGEPLRTFVRSFAKHPPMMTINNQIDKNIKKFNSTS